MRSTILVTILIASVPAAIACNSETSPDPHLQDAAPPSTPNAAEPPPPWPNRPDRLPDTADGCPGIYAEDLLPSFYLEFAPEELAALQDEWLNGAANEEEYEEAGLDLNPYHPVQKFVWEDVEIDYAQARLRGNPTYWLAHNKMQLQISFNEINRKGRFLDQRKLLLDAAGANRSFLRDRLALKMFREAGVPAPCANSARLYINGEYYGLFTSIEKLDKEFLERSFENHDGDLWRRTGWELRTNEDTSDDTRLDALKGAETVEELDKYLDIPHALRVWAMDAVIPNADGPWAGGLNFYLYDDPTTGKFILLPWDLDNGFTRLDYDVDPYTWHKQERFRGRPFYDIALSDPTYFAQYIDELESVVDAAYRFEVLQPRILAWRDQIYDAAFEDPNKPWDNSDFLERVDEVIALFFWRERFMREWLVCWQTGGVDAGDGTCVMP